MQIKEEGREKKKRQDDIDILEAMIELELAKWEIVEPFHFVKDEDKLKPSPLPKIKPKFPLTSLNL